MEGRHPLIAAGRDVAALYLIDAEGPGGRPLKAVPRSLRHYLSRLRHNFRGVAAGRWKVLRTEIDFRLERLRLRLFRSVGVSGQGVARGTTAHQAAIDLAIRNYQPLPYPREITVFRAADSDRDTPEGLASGLGWAMVAPRGVRIIDTGEMDPRAVPQLIDNAPSLFTIDAARSAGPVAMRLALDEAFRRAAVQGSATALVRATTHTGAIGHYVWQAAHRGFVGIHINSGPPNMAYFGAKVTSLATSPIAIGVPSAEGPIVTLPGGEESSVVPDLRGQSARDALRALARLGVTARLRGHGVVIEQTPAAGTLLEPGITCTLVLERDPSRQANGAGAIQ